MSEWSTTINPGFRTKTIMVGSFTIEINRPILSDEEMSKSEATVRQALKSFIRKENNYEC